MTRSFARSSRALAAATALLLSGLSLSVSAAEIAVANVEASSTFYTYNPVNLINGSGLVGSQHTGDWVNKWITDGSTAGTGWLVFDLGQAHNVESSTVWNYGPGCCGAERSVKDLGVSFSTDGLTFGGAQNFVLTNPGTDPFDGQSLALGGVEARFVRFSIDSNYAGDSYAGLSEVKFYGSAVPEPETTGLLLAGLAVVGVATRRRTPRQG